MQKSEWVVVNKLGKPNEVDALTIRAGDLSLHVHSLSPSKLWYATAFVADNGRTECIMQNVPLIDENPFRARRQALMALQKVIFGYEEDLRSMCKAKTEGLGE